MVFCADGYMREESKAEERERGGRWRRRKGRGVLQEPRAREKGYRFERKKGRGEGRSIEIVGGRVERASERVELIEGEGREIDLLKKGCVGMTGRWPQEMTQSLLSFLLDRVP